MLTSRCLGLWVVGGEQVLEDLAQKLGVEGDFLIDGRVFNNGEFIRVKNAQEPADFLDGDYTIFGLCEPVGVVQAITEVETSPSDKPLEDIVMQVHISRCEG